MDPLYRIRNILPARILEALFFPREIQLKADGMSKSIGVERIRELLQIRYDMDERPVIEDVIHTLDQEDVFWDVGSNYGIYSVFGGDQCRTVAFEPDPEVIPILKQRMNSCEHETKVVEKALSDSQETVNLYNMDVDREKGFEVQTQKADDLENLPEPNVVKIDIEGAEMRALKGMEQTLEEVNVIYLEIHPEKMDRFDDSIRDLKGFLKEKDFSKDRNWKVKNELIYRYSRD